MTCCIEKSSIFAAAFGKCIYKVSNIQYYFNQKNRHKAQRKAKFYINKCRSASCMQSGWKQASA